MEKMGTGEKIARSIIQRIQEDSGIEFAVTSSSIEFVTNVIEQVQQRGLEQAADYVESLAIIDSISASDAIIGMSTVFVHVANSIRRLSNNE